MAFILQNATTNGAGTATAVTSGTSVIVSGTFGSGVYARLTCDGTASSAVANILQADTALVINGPCTLNAVVSGVTAGDGTDITVETVV